MTETDIVNFAGLSGDYDSRYVDAEYARTTAFGERSAHGMLVFCSAFGRWNTAKIPTPAVAPPIAVPTPPTAVSTEVDNSSMVAGHLNDTVTFLRPVAIGDTIRCRYKTLSERESKSRPGLHVVTTGLQMLNQRDEVVQEGSTIMMH